jgi:hypothetical protein
VRKAGYRRSEQVFKAASEIPESRLKFATFTCLDVPLRGLRESAKHLVNAARKTLRNAGTKNFALRLESFSETWSDLYHPHVHALLDTPNGGRNYVSADAWETEWLTALPSWLHPIGSGSHVKPVRDLRKTCSYLAKSPYAEYADTSNENAIRRVVDSILATKGIQQFNVRGTFASLSRVT